MKCRICNNELKASDKFCDNCGTLVVSEDDERCESCNAVITLSDKYCGICGTKIERKEEEKVFCHVCNSEVKKQDKFCLNCGAKLSGDVEEDIIASRFQNNVLPKSNDEKLVFWISLGLIGLVLIVNSIYPLISLIFGLGFLGYSIYCFVKAKTKFNGWAIGLSALALLIAGVGFTNRLIERDYARGTAARISEIVDVEIPDIEPEFYSISIMDDQIMGYSIRGYAVNDIIYELDDSLAEDFVSGMSIRFREINVDLVKKNFEEVMLSGTDVSLIYDLDNNTYAFPANLEKYNIIIINYDFDTNRLQILELCKLEM